MKNPTRREFIKQSSLAALAAMTVGKSLLLRSADAAESTFKVTKGEITEDGDWMVAKTPAIISIPLPPEQDVIRIQGKVGSPKGQFGITFHSAAGQQVRLAMMVIPVTGIWRKQKGVIFPDAALRAGVPDGSFSYYVRPKITLYDDDKSAELAAAWEKLPPASDHAFVLELRRAADEIQVWMDGQFVSLFAAESPFTQCDISLSEGAALRAVKAENDTRSTSKGIMPLPINTYPRPGTMGNATIKLSPDAKLPQGLVVPEDAGASNISVEGLGRIPGANIDLQNYMWRLGAVDDIDEARLFSVPLATYSHAFLLCAAEDDPALSPSFTVRLTRYANSRGDAMADTTVTLPEQEKDASDGAAQRVGTVSYGLGKTVPLWLMRVPLQNGQIQDLIYDDKRKNESYGTYRYLDFEFLDPLPHAEEAEQFPPLMEIPQRIYYPGQVPPYQYSSLDADPGPQKYHRPGDISSSVHIFAAALKQSPAAMEVRANVPWFYFYAFEHPTLLADITAFEAGKFTIGWKICDVDGKIIDSGSKQLTLTAGAKQTVEVPVNKEVGWYAAQFRLTDAQGLELVNRQSTFVLLPPDTRKAGFESQYGTWWFSNTHGGEPNIEQVGTMLQRMGIRHTLLPDSLPETITQKYQLTATQIPWRYFKGEVLEERIAQHEAYIRQFLKSWPSVSTLLVGHETGGWGEPFPPPELWGETPPPLDEKNEKSWQEFVGYLTALAQMVRREFPQLKLQYGNTGNSLAVMGELFRRKFPREYIDCIASEDLGQVIVPETFGLYADQDSWFLHQLSQKMGYGDIPLNATYEFIGRRAPSLGLRSQAEWTIRDVMHCQAYGFRNISLNLASDVGDGYYYSIYGASGFCRRYPLMEPRPVYAAMATCTQVLDGAKFVRSVPAGSLTVYAAEFQRDNDWVYVLWVPRGEREIQLNLTKEGKSTFVDIYGREKSASGKSHHLTVTTAPQYLITPSKIDQVTPGKSTFTDDVPPSSSFIVDAMETAANWSIQETSPYDTRTKIPHMKKGKFELREVNDEEMGRCLELELKPVGDVWDCTQEYIMLTLNKPPVSSAAYQHAGIWVKGNGGWGTLKFAVQSGKGSLIPQSLYANWSGMDAFNFEGWNFLQYPLDHEGHWDGKGMITGLLITMQRKMLHLTELQDVPDLTIRLKGVALF